MLITTEVVPNPTMVKPITGAIQWTVGYEVHPYTNIQPVTPKKPPIIDVYNLASGIDVPGTSVLWSADA